MSSGSREVALDRLRGVVVVLMALDHAGSFFDTGHLQTDSLALHHAGMELPAVRFLPRLLSHLCAPTFVFLAGTALFLSVRRRRSSGGGEGSIDRHLLARGLLLIALELSVVTLSWGLPRGLHYEPVLQVIWAIGASFLLMIPLRRVPVRSLAVGAVVYLGLGEWIVFSVLGWQGDFGSMAPPGAVLCGFGAYEIGSTTWSVAYPLLPWLAVMILGWCFGPVLVGARANGGSPAPSLALVAVALLSAFAFVRALNGFGNMGLLRESAALVEWFHVSKYPPSLSFLFLTLGVMNLVLALLLLTPRKPLPRTWSSLDPLVLFGETPLLFYVLHLPLLGLSRRALGDAVENAGPGTTLLATLAVLAVLYPVCVVHRRLKASGDHRWTRLV